MFVNPLQPNLTDYQTFLREQGFSDVVLPANSMWIPITLDIGKSMVNLALAFAERGPSPVYTLAVYNYATDRLLRIAPDQPNQTFFATKRKELGLLKFAAGLVSSSSDNGTGGSVEVIRAAKNMTVTDLEMMKTPWGREYIGAAQDYGPNIWGLS